MSLSFEPIGQSPVAGQSAPATATGKPPPKRWVTAKADRTSQPEPR